MAGEVQKVYHEVDRPHRRGEEAADACATGYVASLARPLGSVDSVHHAHRAVAAEAQGRFFPRRPQAHQPEPQARTLLPAELGFFVLTVRSSVVHPSDVIIPVM